MQWSVNMRRLVVAGDLKQPVKPLSEPPCCWLGFDDRLVMVQKSYPRPGTLASLQDTCCSVTGCYITVTQCFIKKKKRFTC